MLLTRRKFLGKSGQLVFVVGTMAAKRALGANDRIRVAVVGLHGRGKSHILAFSTLTDSEVVALCDVDRKVLDQRASELRRQTGKTPKTYQDVRELLADGAVDVVSIATPNHWHALLTIWACQAGKDVYVEKPLSHNVWEGKQVIAAAAQYNRIVQHGTQRRCEPGWIRAIERLREGVIGEVYMARGLCFKPRGSIGIKQDADPPEWLRWDLWQGPALERPYNPNYVHYNWHWFWDYGNGDLGNQGVHQMDVAVWGLNKGFPVRVGSTGGRYGYKDQGQTPNTQICTYTYADGSVLTFEVRGLPSNSEEGVKIGNLFYGSDGYMVEQRFFDSKGKEIPDKGQSQNRGRSRSKSVRDEEGDPFAAFLRAVRSRSQEDVLAPVEAGHIACAHCHLGNIAYRLGQELTFDADAQEFVGACSAEANALLQRQYRESFEVPRLVSG